ncbi:MAG: hypothetical protein GX567_09090, partial [Clostridia bacterium]|nr:hypothetical protein [Clostridia bacterium]
MNHSSFIDLKIAATVFYPRPLSIVCTSDGFVGKKNLMRHMGCIPTQKFVTDLTLVRDMRYAVNKLNSSVLLFPEASYSFDGTATPLPQSMGKCLKMLGVPVVMVHTQGAFLRDPLYNNLKIRDVDVSAEIEYLLSPEQIVEKSAKELNQILSDQFKFDNFKWQQEHHIKVDEPFRADYLNRVLYKCPHCMTEGEMTGMGTTLTCDHCGAVYELTEYGYLKAINTTPKFDHIPEWYRWERECVRNEIKEGSYYLKTEVDICMMVNMDCIYHVGKGTLIHTEDGFKLDGCDGALHYEQKATASYSLYADYYWYEKGDVICIGDHDTLYYCFPRNNGDIVAKTRIAAEELYRIKKVTF